MKKEFFALITGIFLFVACDSSEDESPNATNNGPGAIENGEIEAMNEAEFKSFIDGDGEKAWAARAFTLAGQTSFTACRLDDIITFKADGTYEYDGGEDLCGAEDNAFLKSGTWDVNFEDLTITFDRGTSNEEVGEVIGITENEIRVKGSYMMMEVRGLYTSN
jgi:hypothetical protein